MKVKETIAFIGEADKISSDLIQKLAARNYPLVLVAKEGNHFEELSAQIVNRIPGADMETIHCEREGCWEADVIVLNNLKDLSAGLAEKIKEVTNQKILVYFLHEEEQSTSTEKLKHFQQSLPNAEWVQVVFDVVSNEMHITGAEETTALMENIFNQAGYKTRPLKTTG